MMTATVADLLDDKLDDIVDGYEKLDDPSSWLKIYVVRDGDVIFYVGRSKDPACRLGGHIGWDGRRGPTSPSGLGRVILGNLPKSRLWIIELWSIEDCKRELADNDTKRRRWDKFLAESRMIQTRRPHLNTNTNPHKRRLPEKYLSHEQSRLDNPAEDLISYSG